MSARQRELIRQAKILRARPDPTGLADDILKIPCQFKIAYRCQHRTQHLEYDPTGEVRLPAPSCNACHNYLDRAFWRDVKSEEGNMRIKLAILMTYEHLMEWGK